MPFIFGVFLVKFSTPLRNPLQQQQKQGLVFLRQTLWQRPFL